MPGRRWLVTGAGGMLGRDVVAVLADAGEDVTGLHRRALDVTDRAAVFRRVRGHNIVVNTAAFTDVDGAETRQQQAYAVNDMGAGNVATACAEHGATLLHLSTDYVFDGLATSPYLEDTPTAPVNVYGRSKTAGEQQVRHLLPGRSYVVRTAWLYGQHGISFPSRLLARAGHGGPVDVVNDQWGQPTWTVAVAQRLRLLGLLAARGDAPPGVYHATAAGHTTWYGFARAVFTHAGLDPDRVRAVATDARPGPAPRPRWTVLGHDRWAQAGLTPMTGWDRMLAAAWAAGATCGETP